MSRAHVVRAVKTCDAVLVERLGGEESYVPGATVYEVEVRVAVRSDEELASWQAAVGVPFDVDPPTWS